MVDLDLCAFVNGVDQFFGERGGAGGNHLDAAEVVVVDDLVACESDDDWWGHVDEGDLVYLDRFEEDFHVECWHDHDLDTTVQRLMNQTSKAIYA